MNTMKQNVFRAGLGRSSEAGFAGWEMVAVLLAISAMSTITTSRLTTSQSGSFFSQATQAKQSEAKQYVGSMNRAQQAYQLEFNKFARSIPDLQLGIKTQTKNYTYSLQAISKTAVVHYGLSKSSNLKSYVGGVFLISASQPKEMSTHAILCETLQPTTQRPAVPIVKQGTPTCGPGTKPLSLTPR